MWLFEGGDNEVESGNMRERDRVKWLIHGGIWRGWHRGRVNWLFEGGRIDGIQEERWSSVVVEREEEEGSPGTDTTFRSVKWNSKFIIMKELTPPVTQGLPMIDLILVCLFPPLWGQDGVYCFVCVGGEGVNVFCFTGVQCESPPERFMWVTQKLKRVMKHYFRTRAIQQSVGTRFPMHFILMCCDWHFVLILLTVSKAIMSFKGLGLLHW